VFALSGWLRDAGRVDVTSDTDVLGEGNVRAGGTRAVTDG